MTQFTNEQISELSAPLSSGAVKTREQGNAKLSYVESWHVIAEANRIFGFDAWDRETVEFKCVSERERKIGKGQYERDGWSVTYIAKVRVTVGRVIREGSGAGHGIDADLGLAHESALKEAESDAMKRALMTFGNPFGLALYDKTQSNVESEADKAFREKHAAAINSLWSEISAISSTRGLELFWKDNVKTINAFDEVNKDRFIAKKDELKSKFSRPSDTVSDIQETFPGSQVVAETVREQSYLEAGE